MELLGLVETVTAAGNLVVRACTAPDVNSAVYDGGNARVGTVKRIFGPVDEPYVTVIPADRGRAGSLIGKRVFLTGEKRDGKGKRRDRGGPDMHQLRQQAPGP